MESKQQFYSHNEMDFKNRIIKESKLILNNGDSYLGKKKRRQRKSIIKAKKSNNNKNKIEKKNLNFLVGVKEEKENIPNKANATEIKIKRNKKVKEELTKAKQCLINIFGDIYNNNELIRSNINNTSKELINFQNDYQEITENIRKEITYMNFNNMLFKIDLKSFKNIDYNSIILIDDYLKSYIKISEDLEDYIQNLKDIEKKIKDKKEEIQLQIKNIEYVNKIIPSTIYEIIKKNKNNKRNICILEEKEKKILEKKLITNSKKHKEEKYIELE